MRTPLALFVLLAGCGAEAPPAPSMPPPPTQPIDAPAAIAPRAAPPPVTPDPTVLTDEQMQRDAARTPLATAVVGAYPNANGLHSALVASFSPDGKRFLYGSLRDGIPEIYEGELAKPADAPRAVTQGPEAAMTAVYARDGKSILYLRDHGGDELSHIWRVGVDGGRAVDLTPGEPLHRGQPFLPRGQPDTMIYSAFGTKSREGLLFVQKLDGGEPKLAYTNPRPGFVADVSDDGTHALFEELESHGDVMVDDIDLATGKARRLYPADGKHVDVRTAVYADGGRRVLVTTDAGGEGWLLLALDARSGKELGRYVNDSPPTAALSAAVSPRGDRLALGVDAGTHGEVRIMDARTLRLQHAVEVPLGDAKVGEWTRDGKGFSILVSQPDRPADPFAVDAATGKVTPLRDDRRPGVEGLPPIHASIASVKAFDDLSIPVNVYLPDIGPGARVPTIVNFHGGPSSSYSVRWNAYTRFFVSLGYAVLEPNVRGSTGFGRAYEAADNREKRADWLRDVEAVNAWTKSQPWCDPGRVVVWGQSYGGYTTLMALTRQPTLWRAGVDLYGPANLGALLLTTTPIIRSVFVAEFGDVEKDAELLARFSPMRDVDKITAPLFVYAGQNDTRVPRPESDGIVVALRRRNIPVEYMVSANEGHGVDRNDNKIELLVRTARFLEDAMRP